MYGIAIGAKAHYFGMAVGVNNRIAYVRYGAYARHALLGAADIPHREFPDELNAPGERTTREKIVYGGKLLSQQQKKKNLTQVPQVL